MRLYRIILLVLLTLILIRVNQIYHEVKPKKLEPVSYEQCARNGLSHSECKIVRNIVLEEIKL